jgi:2-polyprenyl-3-methyl-5-hydroxy-6-metoxy-1,4-benzoquinol methylase
MHRLDSSRAWDTDSQRSFWNSWIAGNLSLTTPREDAFRTAQRLRTMIEALCLSSSATILEVGCANGWFTEILTAYGQITGIDLADSAVEQARQRVPAANFYCGDFNHHPFAERSFDLVVSLETFSHIDQTTFLERVSTLLKPGGHLLLTTQNRYVYLRQVWITPPAEGQVRRWVTTRQLKRMVR